MKKAFTLAEVLITLAIIGIAAALTVPTLVQHYKQLEVVTKLQRVYSLVNQAVLLSEIDNGNSWDEVQSFSYQTATYNEVKDWYNKYLNKYLKSLKLEQYKTSDTGELGPDNSLPNEDLLVYLADGSILKIRNNLRDISFYINQDALNKPIKGKNVFNFRFTPYSNLEPTDKYMKNKKFEPYIWDWDGTRENLINDPDFGCSNSLNKSYCTKLIQYDGWQISKDYPVKF